MLILQSVGDRCPFCSFGTWDQRSEESQVDRFSRMRNNAALYGRRLNLAEMELCVLATPGWDRRIPNSTSPRQEVTA